jgi:hypothetical protein
MEEKKFEEVSLNVRTSGGDEQVFKKKTTQKNCEGRLHQPKAYKS